MNASIGSRSYLVTIVPHGTTRSAIEALGPFLAEHDSHLELEAGFDEHITKPPDPERLEQLLTGVGDRAAEAGTRTAKAYAAVASLVILAAAAAMAGPARTATTSDPMFALRED